MHSYGKQIWTSHYPDDNSNNKIVQNRIDFWNFEFQQTTMVNYTINKGDKLSTHGIYDLTDSDQEVSFGQKSSQEMLFDFLFVYPATNLNGIHSCGTLAGFGISFCGVDIIMEQSPVPDGDLSLPILFESEGNNCTIGSTPQTKDICLSPSTNSPTSTNSTSLKPTKSPIATTKNPTRSPIIKTPTKSPT